MSCSQICMNGNFCWYNHSLIIFSGAECPQFEVLPRVSLDLDSIVAGKFGKTSV